MQLIAKSMDGITLAVEASEPAAAPPNVGFGSIVLMLAVAAFMVWMAYLWLNSRRHSDLETPPNLQPGISDDELENTKLTRVLSTAVVSAAVLAGVMGVYYANESTRQVKAEEKIHAKDVHEGEKWYEFFSCVNCHGPGAVGGGAPFTESRSNISTSWAAPSLNDIFYRFSIEDITEVIVYGRDGTPMPANGLDGGGAMTKQEVEQVIAYLESLQITQGEALDEVEGAVSAALSRLENAEATIETLLERKRAEREDIEAAAGKFAVIEDFPDKFELLLKSDGTCTEKSANLVGSTCGEPGADTDRDGLTDQAEFELTNMAADLLRVLPLRQESTLELVPNPAFDLQFARNDAFTNLNAEGEPIPDLEEAEAKKTALDGQELTLSVTAERQDLFLAQIDDAIAYLESGSGRAQMGSRSRGRRRRFRTQRIRS